MANSSRISADYARATLQSATAPPTPIAQSARRFRPRLWPTLAAAFLLSVFIAAGQWQWTKAGSKNALQQQFDARGAEPAMALPSTPVDAQSLRYRKITARGYYEPQYQILIDNRTHREQAGYHVITPLRLEGSEMRLLINRGWVPALAEHHQLPQLATPVGPLEVLGTAVVPGTRFFTLGADSASAKTGWQSVWQNLDVAAYSKVVSFSIQPVVIELDAHSAAGGFVREWRRPDERVQTNLGYALQWWAFAATTVVFWLVVNFRRPS